MSVVEALIGRSFQQAQVHEANTAIDTVRAEEEGRTGAAAFSYELFVPQANVDDYFLTQALPRLVHFLHCRGFRSTRTPGVFVSLFTPTALHFVEAGVVLEVLGAARHLSVEELFRRYGEGGTGDPKLLGT
ncbi:MAG: hypothetical protein JNJ54_05610 [Myxococcaceae bacterium]|nr:hypothetical protein [Myxococcaceae bacterium]